MADPARITQQYVEVAISEDSVDPFVRITQQYVETAIVNTVVIKPDAGSVTRDQTIELSYIPNNASFYYTLDGSTPDNTDNLYTAQIGLRLRGSFTIKAIAYTDGNPHYPVISSSYVVTDVDPVAVLTVRSLTRTAAVLHCTVTDFGTYENLTVSFEYGTTTSYGIETTAKAISWSNQYTGEPTGIDNNVAASLEGLSDNTTYYARVKITNGVDTWYLEATSFITGSVERGALPEWVEDNLGETPWSLQKSSWVNDNLGEGVWDFTEQPNKWGYLNNPRWVDAPTAPVNYDGREDEEPQIWTPEQWKFVPTGSKQHIPCGHWHKVRDHVVVDQVNIFGVFNSYLHTEEYTLYGIVFDFDKEELSFHGYYEATGKTIEGPQFDFYQNQLLVMEGSGSSAKILQISYDQFSNIGTREYLPVSYKEPFNENDIGSSHRVILRDDSENLFIHSSSNRIIRLDNNYQKEATGYTGTCSVAPTDGNLYVITYIPILYNFWNSPPNGGSNTYFTYIPEQTTDSPITPWGSGGDPFLSAARGVHYRFFLYAGQIWLDCHASPYTEIKTLSRDTFARTSVYRTGAQFKGGYPADPYIFTARNGLTEWSINKLDYDTKAVLSTHAAAGSPHESGTCITYEEYALFCCASGIYSCDIATFTIADYHTDQGGYGEMIPLKDRYFAAAQTHNISVFYLNEDGTLRHVDTITLGDYGPRAGSIMSQSLISTLQLEEMS